MRTHGISIRAIAFVATAGLLATTFFGCSGGGGSDSRLRLINFNLDGIVGAFLNERLIFTFSAPVDPDSVDISTIQIRYDASSIDIDGDCFPDNPANNNAVPEGDFVVDGNRVIFQPRIPSALDTSDIGLFPAHNIDTSPDMGNCVRNTLLTVNYKVTIPGFSSATPDTLRSRNDGKPMVSTFNSTFTTVFDDMFPLGVDLNSFVDIAPGPPQFVGLVDPVEGSTGVALDKSVSVQFNEALLPSSVTAEALQLVGVGPNNGREERIPTSFMLDQLNGIVTMTPLIELPGDVEIRVTWTEALVDFGGNNLVLDGSEVFPSFRTTDALTEGPFVTREEFDTQDNLDPNETSSLWNEAGGAGQLRAGAGGGTAVLGEFIFDPLDPATMVIDTGAFDPANPLPTLDYSTFFLGNNGTILVTGENPLCIRSTQDIIVAGTIDVSGADAADVLPGAVLGTNGGFGIAGGGSGGNGGTNDGDNGGAGEGARILVGGGRHPGGGGGSASRTCASGVETGGGGGANFRNGATPGRGDDGNPGGGGLPGVSYGADAMSPFNGTFAAGSGGGGAGTTCISGSVYPGAGGGAGGGAVWLHAAQEIDVSGGMLQAQILANGGAGGDNLFTNGGTQGGAAGGGGSGGGILMQGIERFINNNGTSWIRAEVGAPGDAAEAGGSTDGGGGGGGFGRIRIESGNLIVRAGRISPPPSEGPYLVDGNSTVGTSTWFDSGVFFPDYSFQIGSRNGGPSDQDNANAYPNPGAAIKYLFQGAGPDPSDPTQPDLANLRPAVGEFSENIDDVDDSQFIRVKVVFTYPFPHSSGIQPYSNFFQFSFTHKGGKLLNP